MAVIKPVVKLRLKHVERVVSTEATQAGRIHGATKIRGRAIEITRCFNHRISCGAKLCQRAVKILWELVAHAVELQADRQPELFSLKPWRDGICSHRYSCIQEASA